MAEAQAPAMLDVHGRASSATSSRRGKLDRALEALPDDERDRRAQARDRGLTRPELAVLLAYAKIDLYAELLDSDVPEDPYLSAELARYFPAPLPERFAERMRAHRLRREIIATQVVNNIAPRRRHDVRVPPARGDGRARLRHRARLRGRPRGVRDARAVGARSRRSTTRSPPSTQIEMLLEGRRLVERGTRWLLRNRRRPLDIAATVEHFARRGDRSTTSIPQLLGAGGGGALGRRAARAERRRRAARRWRCAWRA